MGQLNKANTQVGVPNTVTNIMGTGEVRRTLCDDNYDQEMGKFNNSTQGGLLKIDGSSLGQDINQTQSFTRRINTNTFMAPGGTTSYHMQSNSLSSNQNINFDAVLGQSDYQNI